MFNLDTNAPSESPSLREGLGWVSSDTSNPPPAPEASNFTTSAASSSFQTSNLKSPTPSFAPSPSSLDALALSLTSQRPHTDIAQEHHLTLNQIADLLDSTDLSTRIASLERLQALEHRIRITHKLRAAHEAALETLLEHKDSNDKTESRKAASVILRQTTTMLIALQRAADPSRTSSQAQPRAAGSPTVREGHGPAPGPSLSSSSSPPVAPSHCRPVALPPPAPKPYSSPDLLFPHQIDLLRTHKPATTHKAFQLFYPTLDHPIKCFGDQQDAFKSKLIASTLLNHYTTDYEDLGPPSFDQEVLIPAPVSPDLSLKPVLKHFAIKRYAFKREGTTPLYLRVHLAKQDLVKGETADRWYLADLAIDSP